MKIQETALHCINCKHEWVGETVVDAPIKVFAASIAALVCPSCGAGSKHVAFGRGDVPDPEPSPLKESTFLIDLERRSAWLKLHDSGASSKCIADVMCGSRPTSDHPHDADDFGRCERLLILYPEWRCRLMEMASVSWQWAALVARWDDVVAAWRHDQALWRSKGNKAGRYEWQCAGLIMSVLQPTIEAKSNHEEGVT